MELKVGGKYNWKGQKERLVYLGKNGAWHQFKKIDDPRWPWCEVLDADLHMLEETNDGIKIRSPQDFVETLIRQGWRVGFDGTFEWNSPRGACYQTKELYQISVEIFNDANKHGELS